MPTALAQKTILRSYGAKYSKLSEVPYFNVVRYHVIDPMHNIVLGNAKFVMKVWKDLNLLNAKSCTVLQQKVDSVIPPPKVGRIPRKLGSGFALDTSLLIVCSLCNSARR